MTLVYFIFAVVAVVVGYLGYAFVKAFILSKPTWPFRKAQK